MQCLYKPFLRRKVLTLSSHFRVNNIPPLVDIDVRSGGKRNCERVIANKS
jgi:hypothetical protein